LSRALELFGISTSLEGKTNWQRIISKCQCPFLNRKCLKNRKSDPSVLIGTCCVANGRKELPVIICPHRLLERRQIFVDTFHLLTQHEPGNELHVVPEIALPGGSVDYFVVSVRKGKVRDFVGIELQTVDTTGTVWPERQRFLNSVGIKVPRVDVDCADKFGMNWKMTAKTILVQLHHKVETFEHISKKLVLVLQDHLLAYMRENFAFAHVSEPARGGDPMHFHAYRMEHADDGRWQLDLSNRLSTDCAGVSAALGLQKDAKVEMETILMQLEAKISKTTLFDIGPLSDVSPKTEPS
jgi:hypothetical protein